MSNGVSRESSGEGVGFPGPLVPGVKARSEPAAPCSRGGIDLRKLFLKKLKKDLIFAEKGLKLRFLILDRYKIYSISRRGEIKDSVGLARQA